MDKWMATFQTLPGDPKTNRLRRGLGCSRHEAIGVIISFWLWAMDHNDEGYLEEYDAEHVAESINWRGDPEVLSNALFDSFLDPETLCISGWAERQHGYINLKKKKKSDQIHNHPDIKEQVREMAQGKCMSCGSEVETQGGRTAKTALAWKLNDNDRGVTPSNVLHLCYTCAQKKGDGTLDDAGMPLFTSVVNHSGEPLVNDPQVTSGEPVGSLTAQESKEDNTTKSELAKLADFSPAANYASEDHTPEDSGSGTDAIADEREVAQVFTQLARLGADDTKDNRKTVAQIIAAHPTVDPIRSVANFFTWQKKKAPDTRGHYKFPITGWKKAIERDEETGAYSRTKNVLSFRAREEIVLPPCESEAWSQARERLLWEHRPNIAVAREQNVPSFFEQTYLPVQVISETADKIVLGVPTAKERDTLIKYDTVEIHDAFVEAGYENLVIEYTATEPQMALA